MNLMTVSEYAKEYGCSPQYIRRLIAEGKLKAVKVSERLWLILEKGDRQEPFKFKGESK